MKVDIQKTLDVQAPAEQAWEIIGPNFLNISDWGRGVLRSWRNEDLEVEFEGAPAGGRFCDLGKLGIADERILHYHVSNMEISWSAKLESFPGFLSNVRNELRVEEVDANRCRISSNITAELSGIRGWLLGGPIKKNFDKLIGVFLKDWKVYAETGDVSAAKKRERPNTYQ